MSTLASFSIQRLFSPDLNVTSIPTSPLHDFLLAPFYSSPMDPDAALPDPLAVALIPTPSQAVIHDLLQPMTYLSQPQSSTSLD